MEQPRQDPLSKVQLVPSEQPDYASKIFECIDDSFRSFRKDRCAIFTDPENIRAFTEGRSLQADLLDPRDNFHWTGSEKGLGRRRRRVVAGDYLDWFSWYMKWQRFNAFHILVLVNPIARLLVDEDRGYLDGLLTRVISKPSVHRVIIAKEHRFVPVITAWLGDSDIQSPELAAAFQHRELEHAFLTTLYGRTIAVNRLAPELSKTLSWKLARDPQSTFRRLDSGQLLRRKSRWFRSLNEDGMRAVETMRILPQLVGSEPGEKLFELNRRRKHAIDDEKWLEAVVLTHLDNAGWFTMASLDEYVRDIVQAVMKDESPPKFLRSLEEAPRTSTFLSSRALLRRITETMVSDGRLAKTTWFRELGRPTNVYYTGKLPFREHDRCDQCAFYVPIHRHCRLWWLLGRSFGPRDPRWAPNGEHQLSSFELYKMRNAWRISPRSSACLRFLDKKKDYTRKNMPENCDICGQVLETKPGPLVICDFCRTRYFKARRAVRVLPSYEHDFDRVYLELAGRAAASDVTRLREERSDSTFGTLEQIDYEKSRLAPENDVSGPSTVMIFPGDRMVARGDRLFVFKKREVKSVQLAGSTIVDHGVLEKEQAESLDRAGVTIVQIAREPERETKPAEERDISFSVDRVATENPEFARKFLIAMAESTIHATERVDIRARIHHVQLETSLTEQRRFLRRLKLAPVNRSLNYEGSMMKWYWSCYDLALKTGMQRFGPRKKARFVREYVESPTGRARGYTAVDAAINYLHQRRLFKFREVNAELGLSTYPGEGFLHRRRWKPQNLGLLLDLADPFKFADREMLLDAFLTITVNWRDFHSATDRKGVRFYYPNPNIVPQLEIIGTKADKLLVNYKDKTMTLMAAYGKTISDLIQSLETSPMSFEPFVYDPQSPSVL